MINIPGPVLLDINTQRDLFAPDGALPVFQHSKYLDLLKRVFQTAFRLGVPVISTRLINQAVIGPRGGPAKLVCNPTTTGFQKLPFTQHRRRVEMPADCATDLPVEGFNRVGQYVFDLPSLNLFESPRLDRLLSESTIGEYIIVGAPLEWTVRTAVLGLLQRRAKLTLVSDCIAQWDPYEGDMALRQIESKNVEWLSAEQAIERLAYKPKRPRVIERPPASTAQLNTPHASSASSAARAGKARPKAPAGKFRS